MIGFTVIFALYALITKVIHVFPVQALEGAIWAALGPVAMAYIAEIVPPEEHGWAMGIYARTSYMGWVIGPVLGGLLADAIGFRITFVIGAILVVFGLATTWRYVKEPQKAKG